MRISQRQVLLAASAMMLMAATAAPEAKAASIILPTTGAGGAGNPDTNYHLVSAPAGSPLAALDIPTGNNAAGWVTSPGALWVSPVNPAAGSALPTGLSGGVYTPYDYQLVVPSGTLPAGLYSFSVTFAADDTVALRLNGTSVPLAGSGTPGTNFNYTALTTDTFTATIGASGGTFDFLVFNTGNPPVNGPLDGPSGLLVSAFAATAVPEPSSITIASLGAIGIIGGYGLRRRKAKGA